MGRRADSSLVCISFVAACQRLEPYTSTMATITVSPRTIKKIIFPHISLLLSTPRFKSAINEGSRLQLTVRPISYTPVAILEAICLTVVVDGWVVSTVYLHGRDSIETDYIPLSADFYETDRAEIHRNKALNLYHERRDVGAKFGVCALVPGLLVSLLHPPFRPKCVLNNLSDSFRPSSVRTIDSALTTGLEI